VFEYAENGELFDYLTVIPFSERLT
jgi:hypothetical protein